MPDRHDDVDAWLSERIEPLPPPPGTFELIKRKARRRKFRKLAITAGSAAVIVAAAVTVPQVVNLPVLNPNPTAAPVGAQSHPASADRSAPRKAFGSASPATSSAVPAGPAPVPGNFRPTSVTFVGPRTGWVIGQALTPGHCATQFCTSVARTDDAGKTWAGVPAPMTGAADGASGLSQIRFLDLTDGWAYGPQLFATHTGGRTWAQVDTGGLRVTALETVGDRVFAVWASCTGDGPAYGARLHQVHALLRVGYGRDLGAGGRPDHRADQRSGQRGHRAGAHRQPRLPARAGRGAVLGPGRRQRAVDAGELAGRLVPGRPGPGGRAADRGAARRGERQRPPAGLRLGQQRHEPVGLDPAEVHLLLEKRRGELGADGHGAGRGGGLRAGRQPVGERGARHRPGHRPAARGRGHVADGEPSRGRRPAGSATSA